MPVISVLCLGVGGRGSGRGPGGDHSGLGGEEDRPVKKEGQTDGSCAGSQRSRRGGAHGAPFRCVAAGRSGPPVAPRGSRSSHVEGAREALRQTRECCGLEFSRRDDSPRRDARWDIGLGASESVRHRPLDALKETPSTSVAPTANCDVHRRSRTLRRGTPLPAPWSTRVAIISGHPTRHSRSPRSCPYRGRTLLFRSRGHTRRPPLSRHPSRAALRERGTHGPGLRKTGGR